MYVLPDWRSTRLPVSHNPQYTHRVHCRWAKGGPQHEHVRTYISSRSPALPVTQEYLPAYHNPSECSDSLTAPCCMDAGSNFELNALHVVCYLGFAHRSAVSHEKFEEIGSQLQIDCGWCVQWRGSRRLRQTAARGRWKFRSKTKSFSTGRPTNRTKSAQR